MYAYREFNRDAPIDRPTQAAVKRWSEDKAPSGGGGKFSLKTLLPGAHSPARGSSSGESLVVSPSKQHLRPSGKGKHKADSAKLRRRAALIAAEVLQDMQAGESGPALGGKTAPQVPTSPVPTTQDSGQTMFQDTGASQTRWKKLAAVASSVLKAYVATSPEASSGKQALAVNGDGVNAPAAVSVVTARAESEEDEEEVESLLEGLIPRASALHLARPPAEATESSAPEAAAAQAPLLQPAGSHADPAISTSVSPPPSVPTSTPARQALSHTPQAFEWLSRAEIEATNRDSSRSTPAATMTARTGSVTTAKAVANPRATRDMRAGDDDPAVNDLSALARGDVARERLDRPMDSHLNPSRPVESPTFEPLIGPWPVVPRCQAGQHASTLADATLSAEFGERGRDDRLTGDSEPTEILAALGPIVLAMEECLEKIRQAVFEDDGANHVRELGEWLHRQIPLLREGSDLFQHSTAEDVDGLATALEAMQGTLSRSNLQSARLQQVSAHVQSAFLKLAAGAVIGCIDHTAWHLAAGMQSSLNSCRQLLNFSDISPPSMHATLLQIIPKIRNQLHLATPERLAHSEAAAAHRESHDLLDVVSSPNCTAVRSCCVSLFRADAVSCLQLYELANETGAGDGSKGILQAFHRPRQIGTAPVNGVGDARDPPVQRPSPRTQPVETDVTLEMQRPRPEKDVQTEELIGGAESPRHSASSWSTDIAVSMKEALAAQPRTGGQAEARKRQPSLQVPRPTVETTRPFSVARRASRSPKLRRGRPSNAVKVHSTPGADRHVVEETEPKPRAKANNDSAVEARLQPQSLDAIDPIHREESAIIAHNLPRSVVETALTLDASVPAPNELSTRLRDALRAEMERMPRVEVTPGAISTVKGEVVPLEDEQTFLNAGETLVDGSGRIWNKSGLIEPGRDEDGQPILYPADMFALRRRRRADSEQPLPKSESSTDVTPSTSQPPSEDSSPAPTPKLSIQRRRLVRASSREMREIERSARKNSQSPIDEVAEEDEDEEEAEDDYADSLQEIEDRLDDLNELAEDMGLGDMEMAEEEELMDKLEAAEAGIETQAREHRVDASRRREEIAQEDRLHREDQLRSGATTPL